MGSLKVKGMSCNHCKMTVENAIGQIPNIESVQVDLEAGQATFAESGPVDMEQIKAAVTEAGFEVE